MGPDVRLDVEEEEKNARRGSRRITGPDSLEVGTACIVGKACDRMHRRHEGAFQQRDPDIIFGCCALASEGQNNTVPVLVARYRGA